MIKNKIKRKADENSSDLRDFIVSQNKLLKTDIDSISKAAIDSLGENLFRKFDELSTAINVEIEGVRSECKLLVEQSSKDIRSEILQIDDKYNSKIDNLERQLKLCDLIIKNIPFNKNESVISLVNQICDIITYKSKELIKSVFRLNKATNKGSPIIVKFYDESYKSDFIIHYHKFPNLNLTHLGYETPLRIYINESLSPLNQAIFSKALQLKKVNLISSVTTKNGFVFYRLKDQKQNFKISSLHEIELLTTSGRVNALHGNQNKQGSTTTVTNSIQGTNNLLV